MTLSWVRLNLEAQWRLLVSDESKYEISGKSCISASSECWKSYSVLSFSSLVHVGRGHLCEGPLAEFQEEQSAVPLSFQGGSLPQFIYHLWFQPWMDKPGHTWIIFLPLTSVLPSAGKLLVWKGKTTHVFCATRTTLVKSQFSVPLAKSSGLIFWLLILLMGTIGIYEVLFFFYNLWLIKTVSPETQIWKSRAGLKHFFLFAFLLLKNLSHP